MKITIELNTIEKYVFDTDKLNEPYKSTVLEHGSAIVEMFETEAKKRPETKTVKIEVK